MKSIILALVIAMQMITPTLKCATLESQETVEPVLISEKVYTINTKSSEPREAFNIKEVNALSRFVYGEARGCSIEQQSACVWCVLNRVDSDNEYFPNTIIEVIEQPGQFFGYKESFPIILEIQEVVIDVLMRWAAEADGVKDVCRVLPKEYLYFSGDGNQNYFTKEYNSTDVWDWSLYNPYTE